MNRATLSLLAAATALAAVTGFAVVTAPEGNGGPDTEGAPAAAAARQPVERSSLLCPAPSTSDLAETTYSAFTPKSDAAPGRAGDAKPGKAELFPAGGKAAGKPVVSLAGPGTPVTATASGAERPALVGTADGALAPGWAAQQTTKVAAGTSRGVLGVSCTAPDTAFWFPGASTAATRQDYVHLTNPDDAAAVADVELYGPQGALKSETGQNITVPPRSSVAVLLSTLSATRVTDATVHVRTRAGRVAAAVQAVEAKAGSDWLAASADPTGSVVLPGIPADATSVRLVVFATGEDDADLKVRLAGANGSLTPAGAETLHVKSRMTSSLDLRDVTKGEAGSLVLTPSQGGRGAPVVAAVRIVRGTKDKQEVAFVPATAPIGARSSVADNRAQGGVLSLVAPGAAGEVKVTASAGSGGGAPVVRTYKVKAGTTQSLTAPVPTGLKGSYALTVETVSGGPVHAARMLQFPEDNVPMFTIQTLPDDKGTVVVPRAHSDLSVLDD
ncbi:DUF5719 family protein [Streptomyces candidus]|uniref:Secreted protein n=1 Tax=Streptomyces candidus TaxID=67283 RepID=A0A7X0HCY0_9ACTN|nr:DUF5719 family protein [Streptomyces candidus]MBB6435333.1 hypothetical protein [Streptomyces candidus]GHH47883.1 hypothetical protein GCM10018773_41220 [Streptomyces candidus]